MTLTAAFKKEAHRQGFNLVGVTLPEPSSHIAYYRRWIDAGFQGSMGWMATKRALDRRADPQNILPECQSILVLGAHYPAKGPQISGGKIAAYAGHQDYHHVLTERLQNLTEYIQSLIKAPVPHRFYTDTGPLLERELGVRAGLGWIGKNTCLIHPKRGSYFFLAEILLGIHLDPDPPFVGEYCGSCRRCLQACPTSCIEAPYTLNASRCISYLTIEYKEVIPKPLRSLLGDWIFGCDICQQVCPWNQRFGQHHPVLDDFIPQPELTQERLDQELLLSPSTFRRKFQGSPIKRTKRRGYLRNVATVLGNQQAQYAVPALEAALTDTEPIIRCHAAWALGKIGGKSAATALQKRFNEEPDQIVKEDITQAIQHLNRNP